ncbi:MAG: 30S ribosomal protein S4 [Bacteroidetes bacterium HGW-Bacteroidetes-21]|jgi:small subunit ribosomal protein S4|nr:MAG: 30S ribosomal protein S4 [Bacteroidetes bacterium HGW-Bacteroidetes-21]
MARYRAAKTRIARKFGEPIYGPDKYFEKKKYPPGMHGANRRRKSSEYGVQLREKQKAKYTYGVLERQFVRYFDTATRKKGITGEVLLQLLESRLDNVIYRLGLAQSRDGARQIVSHRHITVNNKVVNIPSFVVSAGDVIAVREKSKSLEVITDSLASERVKKFSWLEWDHASMTGKFLNIPERSEIPENINEQLIVELYSK